MDVVPPMTVETVTGYMSWDHDRLDAILEDVRAHVAGRRWPEAARAYDGFERGLDRHIRLEEEILFPVFEARTGIADGPTAVMREEHLAIRSAVGLMSQAIERRDGAQFGDGFRFLGSVLPTHNTKEEHILYPTIDRLLSDADRAKVATRLHR